MQAFNGYTVGMKVKAFQYTIRNVPLSVDKALRKKAAEMKLSLNRLLLYALAQAAGLTATPTVYNDLDGFAGSWIDDPDVEKALREQRKVDPKDWE